MYKWLYKKNNTEKYKNIKKRLLQELLLGLVFI